MHIGISPTRDPQSMWTFTAVCIILFEPYAYNILLYIRVRVRAYPGVGWCLCALLCVVVHNISVTEL